MAHKASQLFEDGLFDGDVNAIVDFKYSSDPRLTWWFDHHQSAFLTPEDARALSPGPQRTKLYDPSYQILHDVHRDGGEGAIRVCSAPDLEHLVQWANIIDGAQYPDAKTAVELGAPAMKLTLVIEGRKGSEIIQQDHWLDAGTQAGRDRGRAGDPGALSSPYTSVT